MRNTKAQSSSSSSLFAGFAGAPRRARRARLVAPAAALLACLALVAGAGTAAAQSTTERFDVTFESVTSNCSKGRELSLDKGRVALEHDEQKVTLRFEGLAGAELSELSGSQRRASSGDRKIKANATATDAQGRRQRLTVSGRVNEKGIQLLFIAELADAKGDSPCSQSWNVAGKRAR